MIVVIVLFLLLLVVIAAGSIWDGEDTVEQCNYQKPDPPPNGKPEEER